MTAAHAFNATSLTVAIARPALWALAGTVLLLAASVLTGCATRGDAGADSTNRKDIVTDSDEPDSRKRARLRLELATGYFNEGKTTVALDEIKHPNFADAYNLRGLIYMRLSDPRLAEESFRKSIALNPRDANAAHNFGWMLCQQQRYPESYTYFKQALAVPLYGDQAKTLMAQGLCELADGQKEPAERSLSKAYELDAANPITGYNLANLLYQRGDFKRSQFYIRRLNNGEFANAESLWLGIKIERKLGDTIAMNQLGGQLKRRFPQSSELVALEKGVFND
jgi:type IV pilus assembly protein PilF